MTLAITILLLTTMNIIAGIVFTEFMQEVVIEAHAHVRSA